MAQDHEEKGESENGQTKILSYYDVLLRQCNLDTLQSGNWLDDQVMEFFLTWLEHEVMEGDEVAFVPPSTTFLLLHSDGYALAKSILIDSMKIQSKKIVFFALNNNQNVTSSGGTHWSAAIYLPEEGILQHYDSSRPMNAPIARNLTSVLAAVTHNNVLYSEHAMAQQQNAYDCGVYALAVAATVAARLPHSPCSLIDGFFVHEDSSSRLEQLSPGEIRSFRESIEDLVHALS